MAHIRPALVVAVLCSLALSTQTTAQRPAALTSAQVRVACADDEKSMIAGDMADNRGAKVSAAEIEEFVTGVLGEVMKMPLGDLPANLKEITEFAATGQTTPSMSHRGALWITCLLRVRLGLTPASKPTVTPTKPATTPSTPPATRGTTTPAGSTPAGARPSPPSTPTSNVSMQAGTMHVLCIKISDSPKTNKNLTWLTIENGCNEAITVKWCKTVGANVCDVSGFLWGHDFKGPGTFETYYEVGKHDGISYFACRVSLNDRPIRPVPPGNCVFTK